MIRLRSHPAYKPSGIEWVGDIPAHWDVKPLFALMREVKNLNRGMVEQNLLSLSYGNIVRKDIDQSEGLLPESFETYNIIEQGDIVLRLTDLQNDKRSLRSAIAHERGIITSAYLTLRALVAAEYCSHLFRAYDVMKVFYSMGGGLRQSLRFEDVRRIPLLVPPATEAAKVTRYIDRETARIDTLIEKKTCFIELLKEKRQALITHAVTKGLNPEAPMKDSGIEWLGEVPAHWAVRRLKFLARAIIGLTYSPQDVTSDERAPIVLRASNIQNGQIDLSDTVRVNSPIPSELHTRSEDILLCARSGSRDLIGKNLMLGPEMENMTFGAFMTVVRSTYNPFLRWVFNSDFFSARSGLYMTSTVNQLTLSMLNDMPIPLPPEDERVFITSYLAKIEQRIGALVNRTQHSIQLLKERRSALITAAVTGKIDLRDAV